MQRNEVDCVGGIVIDDHGRFLLIQRGNEPSIGCWSVPGGRVEPGESDAVATAREVFEETALGVVVGELAGMVEIEAPDGSLFVVRDYLCSLAQDADPDAVRAGDDADDVGWFSPEALRDLNCSAGLIAALERWHLL